MDPITPARTVYYLPGNGGQLHTGLGAGLLSRGWQVTGRALFGEFRALRFGEQVAAVAEDLQTLFWHPQAHVVANSFGAYLFLHAQAQLESFPGRVLLLSPIIGEAASGVSEQTFIPPQAEKLAALAASGQFAAPRMCEIHVGAEDWQSGPARVGALGKQLGIPVTIAPGKGHVLGKDYVGPLLDRWLTSGARM